MSERPPLAFYCVADSRYFPGAVATINSLRLVGHDEPIRLLDCGLTDAQRELLAPHAMLVAAPRVAGPHMLKTVAPLRHPAEVAVLIDVDMIVTRSLADLCERAVGGRVVAFENNLADRFVPEWEELLDLGPIRRQPYLSSGLVVLGGREGEEVLRLLDDRQRRVDFERTYVRANEPEYPFLLLEQDVLNPILASRPEPDRLVTLPNRLAPDPPFGDLRVVDEHSLRCAYPDGTEPYLLHYLSVPKPWQRPARSDPYTTLLHRLLTAGDVALRPPQRELPRWMRSGALGRAARARARARDRVGSLLRRRLPRRVVARVDENRLRRGEWGR